MLHVGWKVKFPFGKGGGGGGLGPLLLNFLDLPLKTAHIKLVLSKDYFEHMDLIVNTEIMVAKLFFIWIWAKVTGRISVHYMKRITSVAEENLLSWNKAPWTVVFTNKTEILRLSEKKNTKRLDNVTWDFLLDPPLSAAGSGI